MKVRKKLTALLGATVMAAAVMFAAGGTVDAKAAASYKVDCSTGDVSAYIGETVEIPVTVKTEQKLRGFLGKLKGNYDETVLEFEGLEKKDLPEKAMVSTAGGNFSYLTSAKDTTFSEATFALKFKVLKYVDDPVEVAIKGLYFTDGNESTAPVDLTAHVTTRDKAREFTGLQEREDGLYYLKDGEVDTTYNGLYNDAVYGWHYVKAGKVDAEYTGLYNDSVCGWWYIKDGAVDFDYTGLAECEYGWWYVVGGTIDYGYTGLYNDKNCGWWYVENGTITFAYTGLTANEYGWWYVENSTITFVRTGLVYDSNYGWWYVENSQINFGYTGLYNDSNCGWWYVENGAVNFGYTGLVYDSNCGWWYVENGAINFGYTGTVRNAYGVWNVVGGAVRF
jgi:hypothetical protein